MGQDEKLFTNSKINIDKKKIDKPTLKKYEKISPNKKVLGMRFHLFLYSQANPEKEKFPHGWLKKIGEPPVIYDSILITQTQSNFAGYLADRGYNNVKVTNSIRERRKKVSAKYEIDLGEPTIVKAISYRFEDTTIQRFVYRDTINSLIKSDYPFDKLLFQKERERIETYLKNAGFYRFSREYVYYEVSQMSNPKEVDVNLIIKQNLTGPYDSFEKVRRHKRYKIKNVLITPNRANFEEIRINDTIEYQQHQVLYYSKPSIHAKTVVRANNLLPGSLYSLNNVERTYSDYSSLGLFRYINVNFEESSENDEKFGLLNCKIDLAMRKKHSYAFEVNITNSSADVGVRGGVTYNNYNIFKGGEHLQLGITGAIESLENRQKIAEPMREIGFIGKLETPKFILPFRAENFQRRYKPRTQLQLSYNYQNQPKYIRTIANTSFGYNWRTNVFSRHEFNPIDFYLVKLPRVDTAYIESIYGGTRLENSFVNHTILGGNYSYEFNNQKIKRGRSFIYVKYNLESAGLLLNAANRMANWGADSLFFGVEYFQYIKTDIDFRNYNIISPRDKFVYRLFAGIGLPYGNSVAMPFEKMYWSGGPYGIRAWAERTLGPGPYHNDSSYNQLGDIKLEANFEYRFKVFWKMEGALFADAGNIWLLEDVEGYPRSGFNWNTFYKDIAVGVGFGMRFDFSFVLLRTDFGFKLRDPSITEGSKLTFQNPQTDFWDLTFQFGIGYPF